jgi:excinuclease ABC subunit B
VEYNEANDITPQSIVKPIDMSLVAVAEADYVTVPLELDDQTDNLSLEQLERLVADVEKQMREAAQNFEFEKAAQFRDRMKALKTKVYELSETAGADRGGAG